MSLSLDKSAEAECLRFLARFCGASTSSASTGPVRVSLAKHTELYQVATIAKHLARQADREAELCGSNALESAQVVMWIDFALGLTRCPPSAARAHWQVLERALASKTYLAASRATLADAALFWVLFEAVKGFTRKQRDEFANLTRWFDQMQSTAGVRGFRNLELVNVQVPQYALTF